ncbi:MAG: xanthine dehydrogenase family protein subunit M [Chloroflexota bacterium]|nr:xanthine dehydrogenase family protein subunit M [Chloroflexota bacterium]
MKPAPFAYLDPRSLPEALEVLARYGDEGKVLAGGQSLVPLLNMRLAQPEVLIDVNRVSGLQGIDFTAGNGRPGVAIGAMTRQRTVEGAGEVLARLPMLADAIRWVGHPQIRNRGTIGGSIAHADPAAELPLLFRALDGVASVQSQDGKRSIPAADFFVYALTSALEPSELLTEIWLPLPPPRTGQAFLEVARRHGDFALVAVAVSLTLDVTGRVQDAVIAIGGAAPTPIRAERAEESLRGELPGSELFRQAGRLASGETEPTSDVHADAEYRREVAGTLTYRALRVASERVSGGKG